LELAHTASGGLGEGFYPLPFSPKTVIASHAGGVTWQSLPSNLGYQIAASSAKGGEDSLWQFRIGAAL